MSTVAAPVVPFKGLSAFGDSDLDALFFFGREREREIVVANLMAARLTVLYGPSGVGKSSLLRAGVAHALHGIADARVVVFSSWPENAGAALKHAIAADFGLDDVDAPLPDVLATASAAIDGDVYLVLDQFEEYFLYHEGEQEFASELAETIRRPGLRANVLIGIREDALAKLDAFKSRIPGLFSNSLRLDRLDRTAGEAAIVGPVNAYNGLVPADERVEVEPALVSAVLDQVASGRVDLGRAGRGAVAGQGDGQRIEAPYLQLVLERLWHVESAQGSRRLRLETLEALGGAARIVEEHLDRAMAALSPPERDAAAAMYHHLVTPSGAKIAHDVSDLARYAALDERSAAAVLQRLSDQRIVRTGENGGAARYEIFHDVLADAVLAWRARYEAERVLAAERSEADRRHRRLLVLAVGALLALGLVSTLAVYAFVERSNARKQAARAEAARVAAVEQQHRLDAARKEALRQKTKAQRSAAAELRAEQRAKASAADARFQAKTAKQATATAVAQRHNAEAAQRTAERERQNAEASAARERTAARVAKAARNNARRSAAKAVRSAGIALRQKRLAQARQLAADARALLDENTERSVRTALAAVAAYRSARANVPVELEDTLRNAFLSLRLRAVLPGGGAVRSVSFGPDGSKVLTAGAGGVRVFDRARGYRPQVLRPTGNFAAAVFSRDGRLIAAGGAGGRNRNAYVWDAETGALLSTLRHDGAVVDLEFSPNNELLATASADSNARLWTIADGLPVATFPHPPGARHGVFEVTFSPDGRRLLTVGGDRFARVFDVATQRLVFSLNGVGFLNAARYSHDGKLIAAAGNDPTLHIFNAVTGVQEYALRQASDIKDVVFSPDDTLVATAGGRDALARVWRLSDRTTISMVPLHLSGVEQVRFTPDGATVVSRGRDGNVYLWASDGGFTQAALLGHSGPVNDFALSRDGGTVVTGSDDKTARVWDGSVSSTGPTPRAVAEEIGRHAAAVNTVAFSADGRYILSSSDDGTARLLKRGGRTVVLRHDDVVTSAVFARGGNRLITSSRDGTARVWKLDGTVVSTLRHGAPVLGADLNRNGTIAVTAGGDGVAILWNARTGAPLHRLVHSGAVNSARFSPNGKLVVTASADRTAALWRVSDGRRIATLTGHDAEVTEALFAPNGRRVATASDDDTARIWNVETGASKELEGHAGNLTDLAFNPSGSLLVTSGLDRDARVWNVRTGEQVALLRIHAGFIGGVAFSADGRWLATGGPEAVGVWESKGTGHWPRFPLYLVRAAPRPTNDVAFSPHGWTIVTGSRDGSVRSFNCVACARTPTLAKLARARLHEIAKPH